MQAHLRPLPGAHPHLRDLPLLRVPPHLQVCLLPGCLLQGMELEGARPLHPLSPQPRALVVGGLAPPAWLQPLQEPNSGKSASRRKPQGGLWAPKLRVVAAQVVGVLWKR